MTNTYEVKYKSEFKLVRATSPRQALKLATDSRAICGSAWHWIKHHTEEGFYGPLSITRLPPSPQLNLF